MAASKEFFLDSQGIFILSYRGNQPYIRMKKGIVTQRIGNTYSFNNHSFDIKNAEKLVDNPASDYYECPVDNLLGRLPIGDGMLVTQDLKGNVCITYGAEKLNIQPSMNREHIIQYFGLTTEKRPLFRADNNIPSILLKIDENIRIQEKTSISPAGGGMSAGGIPPTVRESRSYSSGGWTVNIDPKKKPTVVKIGNEQYYEFPETILSGKGVLLDGQKVDLRKQKTTTPIQPQKQQTGPTPTPTPAPTPAPETTPMSTTEAPAKTRGKTTTETPTKATTESAPGQNDVEEVNETREELSGEQKAIQELRTRTEEIVKGIRTVVGSRRKKVNETEQKTSPEKAEESAPQNEEMGQGNNGLSEGTAPLSNNKGQEAVDNATNNEGQRIPTISSLNRSAEKKENTTKAGAVFRSPTFSTERSPAPNSRDDDILFEANDARSPNRLSEAVQGVQAVGRLMVNAEKRVSQAKKRAKVAEEEAADLRGQLAVSQEVQRDTEEKLRTLRTLQKNNRKIQQERINMLDERIRREAMVENHRKETTKVYLPYHMTDGTIRYTPISVSELEKWSTETSNPKTSATQEPQMVTLTYKNIDGKDKTISVPADKVEDYGNEQGKEWKTAQQVLSENKKDQVVTRSETKLMRNTCGGCSYFTERIGEIKDAHWETQLQSVPVCGPLGRVRWYQQQYVNVQKPATPEVTYTPAPARRTRG